MIKFFLSLSLFKCFSLICGKLSFMEIFSRFPSQSIATSAAFPTFSIHLFISFFTPKPKAYLPLSSFFSLSSLSLSLSPSSLSKAKSTCYIFFRWQIQTKNKISKRNQTHKTITQILSHRDPL